MFHLLKCNCKPFSRCKLFTSNVIPNKHAEKVESDEKRPENKKYFAFSLEYKLKISLNEIYSVFT